MSEMKFMVTASAPIGPPAELYPDPPVVYRPHRTKKGALADARSLEKRYHHVTLWGLSGYESYNFADA